MEYTCISPCHFGLEAVLKKEVLDLGYEIVSVEDGKVTYKGDETLVPRANMFLRTTERVLLKVGSFTATTFEELFERTKSLPWENYIPENGKFWVTKANSVKSKLFSPSDIQSIMKKAMVERLKQKYKVSWFPEDGAEFPIRVSIVKDEVTIGLDTSGVSLHKRGYRRLTSKAPITETLAAALIMLTPWHADRFLIDPFCGSGTIPIEAAMIGMNIAPGMKRDFLAETWSTERSASFAGGEWLKAITPALWADARKEAKNLVRTDVELNIQGFDIDPDIIKCARANAQAAGVGDKIHFQQRDVRELSSSRKYGFIITNPPYGERLEEKEALPYLYKEIGKAFGALDTWSYFLITSYEDAQKYIGRKADKNRKIYNGMLKTYFYQYMGPKPPKRDITK